MFCKIVVHLYFLLSMIKKSSTVVTVREKSLENENISRSGKRHGVPILSTYCYSH